MDPIAVTTTLEPIAETTTMEPIAETTEELPTPTPVAHKSQCPPLYLTVYLTGEEKGKRNSIGSRITLSKCEVLFCVESACGGARWELMKLKNNYCDKCRTKSFIDSVSRKTPGAIYGIR